MNCGNEFQICLHVLEHPTSDGSQSRYTIGVWDNSMQPPGLRSLCLAQPIEDATIAIAREFAVRAQKQQEAKRSTQWSTVSTLIGRLRDRKDADSNNAADEIGDLLARLHNRTGETEDARSRLTRLGCLIEEVAAKAQLISSENGWYRSVLIPEEVWSNLLAVYRNKQEGWQLYRDLYILRQLAAMTADTLRTVENWLGNAGTRESAMDSLWRLTRFIQGLGYELPIENLTWRGQLVRALEEAGLGIGADGTIRIRRSSDKYWQPATGPEVKLLLHNLAPSISSEAVVNHEQHSNGH